MRAVSAPRLMKQPTPCPPRWGFGMSRPLGVVWGAQARKRPSAGPFSPRCTPVYPACFTTKISCFLPPHQQGDQAYETTDPLPPPGVVSVLVPPWGEYKPTHTPKWPSGWFCMYGGYPPAWVSGPTGRHLGYPPYIQNQPSGHWGAFAGPYYPQGPTHTETPLGGRRGAVVSYVSGINPPISRRLLKRSGKRYL